MILRNSINSLFAGANRPPYNTQPTRRMMAQAIRVGIMGAGWPGRKHAEGYKGAGGFEVTAVADLIPGRRKAIVQVFPGAREFTDANALLNDPQVDAVSICLPNDLHAPLALAALKAGKHVICETPPTTNASDAKKLVAAAAKAGKVLLYAAQRRFGGAEQAAEQALAKGYAGEIYHALRLLDAHARPARRNRLVHR